MKPENILLDGEGHIRLTDFGLSKTGIFKTEEDMTYTICGTPEYLAPEIVRGEGHGKAVDWWSLGALLYEMQCGRPPHQNNNKMQLLYTIATKKIDFTRIHKASEEFLNLLRRLLTHTPLKRIGGSDTGAEEIKKHPFFYGVDWEVVGRKEMMPPFKPKITDEKDTANIDRAYLGERPIDSPVANPLTNS